MAAVRAFATNWRAILHGGDFNSGCPVVAATMEGEPLARSARDAAGRAFEKWVGQLSDAFQRQGVEPARARSLSTMAVAAVEGAIVLGRAQRSTAPLERVGDELERLVEEALS